MGLATVGDLFRQEDQVSANVAYSILDNGGIVGVLLIGTLMGSGIADGIVYVLFLRLCATSYSFLKCFPTAICLGSICS